MARQSLWSSWLSVYVLVLGGGGIQVPSQAGAFLVWCVHYAAKVSLQRGD